jgi:hypothetical protein
MPDLSSKGIGEWLRLHSEVAPHELTGISAVELPASVMPALVRFGETLDYALGRDAAGLSERLRSDPGQDLLRTILAHVGPAHCLRLLEWLSQPELGPQHLLFDALLAPDPRGAERRSARLSAVRIVAPCSGCSRRRAWPCWSPPADKAASQEARS